MHWIIFGVMLILAQSPARRKCHPYQHHHHPDVALPAFGIIAAAGCTSTGWWLVEASPVPLNLGEYTHESGFRVRSTHINESAVPNCIVTWEGNMFSPLGNMQKMHTYTGTQVCDQNAPCRVTFCPAAQGVGSRTLFRYTGPWPDKRRLSLVKRHSAQVCCGFS